VPGDGKTFNILLKRRAQNKEKCSKFLKTGCYKTIIFQKQGITDIKN